MNEKVSVVIVFCVRLQFLFRCCSCHSHNQICNCHALRLCKSLLQMGFLSCLKCSLNVPTDILISQLYFKMFYFLWFPVVWTPPNQDLMKPDDLLFQLRSIATQKPKCNLPGCVLQHCAQILHSGCRFWDTVFFIYLFFWAPFKLFPLLYSGHFLLPFISEKCNLIADCVCPGPPSVCGYVLLVLQDYGVTIWKQFGWNWRLSLSRSFENI